MIKKILFCSPQSSAFTNPVNNAYLRLGYNTRVFDFQKGSFVSRAMGYTANKLLPNQYQIQKQINLFINAQLLQIVQSWKPDMVFIIKGSNITIDTLTAIRSSSSILVNWYADWMVVWDWIKDYSPHYDYFFNMCYDVEKAMRNKHPHANFILPAANPDQIINQTRHYPVTFIGQFTHRRERYFKGLADLGLKIWGYEGWQSSSVKNIASKSVSNEECLDILRSSEIAVNILTGTNNFEPEAINVRTFEALGTGTFLLVHDNPLLHKYFTPGKDFITFSSPKDLKTKVVYYLHHESERNKIALRGWNTVRRRHTYDLRIRDMMKIISETTVPS